MTTDSPVANTPPRPLKIGILYESDEWSDHKLKDELIRATASLGRPCIVELIDLEEPDALDEALNCDALIGRIFASAAFRGHRRSLAVMPKLAKQAEERDILLLNPERAHLFEVDKRLSTITLGEAGVDVPVIYAWGIPGSIDPSLAAYPCIMKPNCGGRTTFTTLASNRTELESALAEAPQDMEFLIEEYKQPVFGYITRVEIVGGKPRLVVKRSIAPNGLSAYHLGSTYELYEDVNSEILAAAERAAAALGFTFGSFDVVETPEGAYFIDANSVSNVSEDCTELFSYDMMRDYAETIAGMIANL